MENLQDQHAVVKNAAVAGLFNIFDLRRGELVVKKDELDLVCLHKLAQLTQLALAQIGARVGAAALLCQNARDRIARRLGQAGQLLQVFLLPCLILPGPKQGGKHRPDCFFSCPVHALPPMMTKGTPQSGCRRVFQSARPSREGAST